MDAEDTETGRRLAQHVLTSPCNLLSQVQQKVAGQDSEPESRSGEAPGRPRIVTLGVYGSTEAGFFAALSGARVDTFCDLRRRRGVRGSAYAFANRQRLQTRLAELGLRYLHFKDLAPSQALRERQKAADRAERTAKRQRAGLSELFVTGYREECLGAFDSRGFIGQLGPEARIVALFCVERAPAACHRSLVAERLQRDLGLEVVHLTPE
jgi:uncharacterized protein (DUF488 family)